MWVATQNPSQRVVCVFRGDGRIENDGNAMEGGIELDVEETKVNEPGGRGQDMGGWRKQATFPAPCQISSCP